MATSQPSDVPLDALSLVEAAIREDARAQIVILENADLAAVALPWPGWPPC
jgi:hypothetical protein